MYDGEKGVSVCVRVGRGMHVYEGERVCLYVYEGGEGYVCMCTRGRERYVYKREGERERYVSVCMRGEKGVCLESCVSIMSVSLN